jgi:hypothetical protein
MDTVTLSNLVNHSHHSSPDPRILLANHLYRDHGLSKLHVQQRLNVTRKWLAENLEER